MKLKIGTGRNTQKFSDDDEYRLMLADLVGVVRYEDVLRILDRLVFTLQNSDPLVLNNSAQYEIFRALLKPEISAKLRQLEAEIVSKDSEARNLRVSQNKLAGQKQKEAGRQREATKVRAELTAELAELERLEAEEL